jgi:[ribosomal protein S18]-alanine N-acetyltransferase
MIVPMSLSYAEQISGWIYDNEYAVYSFHPGEETLGELMDGTYYAFLDSRLRLAGYFCFGKSAQIPTVEKDAYTSAVLDMGLGMEPALCGRGHGRAFVQSGMAFAHSRFQARQIRLSVAAWNLRAIRTYESLGFRYDRSVTHSKTQQTFNIMIYAE